MTTADTWEEVKRLQVDVSDAELQGWVRASCVIRDDDILVSADGRPVLLDSLWS